VPFPSFSSCAFREQEDGQATLPILLRPRREYKTCPLYPHTFPILNNGVSITCPRRLWPTAVNVTWFVSGNNREIRSARARPLFDVSLEENV
jgi:hypothetical protein